MAFDKQSEIKHPLARSERLVIQNIGDETVVYDEDAKTAHALKPLAAAVFMYADGSNSTAEIAELASYRLSRTVGESEVKEAVAELDRCALLDAPKSLLEQGISRRTALKSFGAAAAGTMLISSVAAPFASAQGTNYGANFACGTGTSNLTGTYDGNSISWPQPYSSEGTLDWSDGELTASGDWAYVAQNQPGGPLGTSTSHDYGSPCVVATSSGYCSYEGTDTGVSETQCGTSSGYGFYLNPSTGDFAVDNTSSDSTPSACVYENSSDDWEAITTPGLESTCGTGFYVNSSSDWVDETVTVVGSTAATVDQQACVYEYSSVHYADFDSAAVSHCDSSHGICVYTSTTGGHEKGQYAGTPTMKSGSYTCSGITGAASAPVTGAALDSYYEGTWEAPVHGTWTTTVAGTYQCVPCDGDVSGCSYQCCQAVCVPDGDVVTGAISSGGGSIASTTSPGGGYSLSACEIWGGTEFCGEGGYTAKWCTDNPCNTHTTSGGTCGDCQTSSYST